jgi:hypothetical protein
MSEEQGNPQDSQQGNSLADALDGFNMDVDPATGEFVFSEATQTPVVEGAAGQPSPAGPSGGTPNAQDSSANPGEPSPATDVQTLQKRLKDTQAALTQATQKSSDLERKLSESDNQYVELNARLDGMLEMFAKAGTQAQPGSDPTQAGFPDDGFETPQQLKAYLDSQIETVARGIVESVIPSATLSQMSEDYQIRAELQEALAAHPDLPQYAEDVRLVINQRPELSFSQAVELVKRFKGVTGNSLETPNPPVNQSTQGHGVVTPATHQGGAVDQQTGGASHVDDAIAARAQKLGTVETPSGGSGIGKGPVRDVKDAVQRALEELNMS